MAPDPLCEACAQIGAFFGVVIPARDDHQGRPDLLVEPAGLRCRRVLLEGPWWRLDNGPLLVYEEGGRPRALLPTRGGYGVTADEAQRFDGTGFCFFQALPPEPLDLGTLVREGLRALAPGDLRRLFASGMAWGLLALSVPLVTTWLLSEVLPRRLMGPFVAAGVALGAAALAGFFFQELRTRSAIRISQAVGRRLDPGLWDRLLRLPAGFFRARSSGQILQQTTGLSQVRRLAAEWASQSLLTGFFALWQLVVLFLWSPPLAWAGVALLGVSTAVSLGLVLAGAGLAKQDQVLEGRILANLVSLLQGLARIRLGNSEAAALALWSQDHRRRQTLRHQRGRLEGASSALQAAWSAVCWASLAGLYSGGLAGPLTLATFLGFLAAFQLLQGGLRQLTAVSAEFLDAWLAARHGLELFQGPPEESSGGRNPGVLSGAVELVDVCFAYHGGPPVLEGLDLRVASGEYLAVTGASGSGKSTLIRLLLGFETPQRGALFYDGLELSGLDKGALRRQVGAVLQDGRILAGTLLDNLSGGAECRPEQAWEALRQAGFEEDVRAMPMGLYTLLSEGGTTLSGGQRQRLLLARALVSRPRILLLDEATSALDNRTQNLVIQALGRVGVTRIVVAHRLSTLTEADRIVVLHGGRVAETGTYTELMTAQGAFADLVRRQTL